MNISALPAVRILQASPRSFFRRPGDHAVLPFSRLPGSVDQPDLHASGIFLSFSQGNGCRWIRMSISRVEEELARIKEDFSQIPAVRKAKPETVQKTKKSHTASFWLSL
jgi:hypothetical protein